MPSALAELAPNQEENIHFYLVNIDIIESLKDYGIIDAKSAHDKGCTFSMKLEINLPHSNPAWNTVAQKNITVS